MPPKKKVDNTPVYTCWQEVDAALAEITDLNKIIGAAETKAAALDEKANELRAGVADLIKERKTAEKNMEEFCTTHIAELGGARSKKLNHGTISFKADKVCIVKTGLTIAAALAIMLAPLQEQYNRLVEKLAKRYVRVKTEIDKQSARADFLAGTVDNAKLAPLGLEVVDTENFGYTLAAEKSAVA